MTGRGSVTASGNLSQHSFEIVDYIPILETQHLDSRRLQKCLSGPVTELSGIMIVCSAVKLDGQLCRYAVEIEYVWSYPVLAAKSSAGELPSLKLQPERCFRSG